MLDDSKKRDVENLAFTQNSPLLGTYFVYFVNFVGKRIMNYKYSLNSKLGKFTCPVCGFPNRFAKYANNQTGEFLDSDVGMCDRKNSCGYHYSWWDYFRDNPTNNRHHGFTGKSNLAKLIGKKRNHHTQQVDYIDRKFLFETLGNYERNNFVQFLLKLFPNDVEIVSNAISQYLIGTFDNYYGAYTCFPYIDQHGRIERGKLIRFNLETGNRLQENFDTDFLVKKLQKTGKVKENFQNGKCLFGEHLITKYPDRPIAIVEAEKTAIIASMCENAFPQKFVWLGAGSCMNLTDEKIPKLSGRKIILYPDSETFAFDRWKKISEEGQLKGLDVSVSNILDSICTDAEKEGGLDLADFLITYQVSNNHKVELRNNR